MTEIPEIADGKRAAILQTSRLHICDFCGKDDRQVRIMIVTPDGRTDICDECVGVCVGVIANHDMAEAERKLADKRAEIIARVAAEQDAQSARLHAAEDAAIRSGSTP